MIMLVLRNFSVNNFAVTILLYLPFLLGMQQKRLDPFFSNLTGMEIARKAYSSSLLYHQISSGSCSHPKPMGNSHGTTKEKHCGKV